MIGLLIAALASAASVVDAERVFDRAAAHEGQWTAFRRYAAPDATMFVPQPVNAHDWLNGRKDPQASVRWQPIAAYVSCDGHWAADTGGWQRPDGGVGYYTTIWHHDRRGWHWLLDHGDALAMPRAAVARPPLYHAVCGGEGRRSGFGSTPGSGYGASDDATLRWQWHVAADGARTLAIQLWDGHAYRTVIDDAVPAASR